MDPYIDECTHRIFSFDQPYPTLLTSCIKITYDNYNTTIINETFIIDFLATTLQLLYWIFVLLNILLL